MAKTPINPNDALLVLLQKLEQRIDALERSDTYARRVTALPTFGRPGRIVMLTSDNKLYVDTGSAWVAQT